MKRKVLSISYQILVKRSLMPLEFRKNLGWILVLLQGLLVAFNLKQLFFYHYPRAHGFSVQDRDGATKCAYGFKQYLVDHVILSVSFSFRAFCTSAYTFAFILNNLAVVEPAIWKGDVSQGQGWLLVEGSHLSLPLQHTHTPASANPVSWCLSYCLVG